jgi:hypothetical protein
VNVCAVNGEAISEEEAFCSDCGVAVVAPAKQPDNLAAAGVSYLAHRIAR